MSGKIISNKKCYDERQIAEQGKSFRNGFITAVAYMMLLSVLDTYGVRFEEFSDPMYIGIALCGAVTAITMIIKDAYDTFNMKNTGKITASILIIGGILGIIARLRIVFSTNSPLFLDGNVVKGGFISLVVGFALISIGAAYWGKCFYDKKHQEPDE